MALPHPARSTNLKVAPQPAMIPRLTSNWEKRQSSAAMAMSAASINSTATVKLIPFRAITTGLVRMGSRRSKGSTSVNGI
ncbi:hypothetical protein D3C78_1184120 [compost metagenome]